MDADSKTNPYDLDSDGDGITDVKEAFPTSDSNNDGRIDGSFNSKGWSTTVAALGSLNLANTDGTGAVNAYDIDADDDGIPDNIEGQTTVSYVLPAGADTDNDGIDNSYDNSVSFGGNGIPPVDTDGDGAPDYLDTDTDGDGILDIYEGNDYNSNGIADDGVALSGSDSDGDGLDNYFDLLSSAKGTSLKMGNGGSLTGDPAPGTKATVQRLASNGCGTQRDWRCVSFVLNNCNIISFRGSLHKKNAELDWSAFCQQDVDYFILERSVDGIRFSYVDLVKVASPVSSATNYHDSDDIAALKASVVYYRLKSVSHGMRVSYSNTVFMPVVFNAGTSVQIIPNPVRDQLKVNVVAANKGKAEIIVYDANGKIVIDILENVKAGSNSLAYPQFESFPGGMYYLQIRMGENVTTRKFNKRK